MRASQPYDFIARRYSGPAQPKQPGDLRQCEAQALCPSDELHFIDCPLAIQPISRFASSCRVQEADSFVIPNSRDRNAGRARQFTNVEIHNSGLHAEPQCKVKGLTCNVGSTCITNAKGETDEFEYMLLLRRGDCAGNLLLRLLRHLRLQVTVGTPPDRRLAACAHLS